MADDSVSASYQREDLSIETKIGPPYRHGIRPFAWGRLRLEFTRGPDPPNSTIEIRIPISYADELAAGELQEAVATAARDLLNAAAADLAAFDGGAMRRISAEIEDHQADA
jgi:hypothetical protein